MILKASERRGSFPLRAVTSVMGIDAWQACQDIQAGIPLSARVFDAEHEYRNI
ncbi:MAG: hypothetical protein HFJ84_05545 [Clostridiales bacterium]|nr:hypothetical protein [Clostridiales bacterium]